MTRLRHWPWTKIVLVLSLALNLAVAGAVVGALSHREDTARRMPFDRDRSLFALIAVLPPERREALHDALGGIRDGHRDGRQEQARLRGALLDSLRARELSATDLTRLLAAQRGIRAEGAERIESALAGEIMRMTPEERAEYAGRLERFSRFRKDDRPPPH
ncbi:MAG: periplasmic heavy metal sensor [Rhodobacteraceae bacterium]|nr:periplasmic heavy metal sensor [Paracoccaceae bacterium]